jgi:NAD(P)-dependent dehydrogenase (short-subunit alcohol dehydrogenase family)/acyl carrier protein
VDVVFNSLAGAFIPKSLAVLKKGGRFVEIGKIEVWDPAKMAAERPDVTYLPVDLMSLYQQDLPHIQTMLGQLLDRFAAGSLQPLPRTTFPLQEAIQAFHYMKQASHIGKVVLVHPHHRAGEVEIRGDATYLITGGLGGLGLAFAQWLVDEGARNLVLVGRSGLTAGVAGQVHALQAAGAHVQIMRADVADEEALTSTLAEVRRSMPPLRGIIHAAGRLDDGVLVQQNWARFRHVMDPKVRGAWFLHCLTRDLPLDFFVMFSSVAALFGASGQANHAAANAFLDALAAYRVSQGLAGSSINWGAWSEIGSVAKPEVAQDLKAKGMGCIPTHEGIEAFAHSLTRGLTQLSVVPIHWPSFLARRSRTEYFSAFAQVSTTKAAGTEAVNMLERVRQAHPHEREALLEAHVAAEFGAVLGLPANRIDPKGGFVDQGMDSLTTIELLNRLRHSLEFRLPSTATFDYPNVKTLAAYLTREMFQVPQEPPSALEAPAVQATAWATEIERQVEAIDDEDVEAWLYSELEGIERSLEENSGQ